MLLYCTPGGKWSGTEKDYKAGLKAEGVDFKTVARKQVDVPTAKAALLEFLTFHNVNPIGGPLVIIPPSTVTAQIDGDPLPAPVVFTSENIDLDALFQAAPLGQQLTLAGIAVENAFKNQQPK